MKHGLVFTVAIVAGAFTSVAQAETTRIRIPVSSLPRQDEATTIDPKTAVLPDGAREGGPVPKGWELSADASWGDQSSHCTDDRRASVARISGDSTMTEKIWETHGKVYFDRAHVEVKEGKVHVVSAERRPVVYVSTSVWAYRRGDSVRLVMARDSAIFSRAIFWGCSVEEHAVSLPAGAAAVTSSPEQVDEVMREVFGLAADDKRTKPPPWKGVAFRVLASVSRASADTEPMLNVVIGKP